MVTDLGSSDWVLGTVCDLQTGLPLIFGYLHQDENEQALDWMSMRLDWCNAISAGDLTSGKFPAGSGYGKIIYSIKLEWDYVGLSQKLGPLLLGEPGRPGDVIKSWCHY